MQNITSQVITDTLARIPNGNIDSTIAKLVLVRLHWRPKYDKAYTTQDMMLETEAVVAYITAKLELNFEPGIDPHNGRQMDPIWMIEILKLDQPSPYWHTTTGLQCIANGGAKVLKWNEAHSQIIWQHPQCIRYSAANEVNRLRLRATLKLLPICDECLGISKDENETVPVPPEAFCICQPAQKTG